MSIQCMLYMYVYAYQWVVDWFMTLGGWWIVCFSSFSVVKFHPWNLPPSLVCLLCWCSDVWNAVWYDALLNVYRLCTLSPLCDAVYFWAVLQCCVQVDVWEGEEGRGRKGEGEGEREGGKERGREGEREGGREKGGGRERERVRRERVIIENIIIFSTLHHLHLCGNPFLFETNVLSYSPVRNSANGRHGSNQLSFPKHPALSLCLSECVCVCVCVHSVSTVCEFEVWSVYTQVVMVIIMGCSVSE